MTAQAFDETEITIPPELAELYARAQQKYAGFVALADQVEVLRIAAVSAVAGVDPQQAVQATWLLNYHHNIGDITTADISALMIASDLRLKEEVTLKSHGKNGGGLHSHQLSMTIGSVITVSESQTEHTSRYVIIGEAHKLTASATLLETTWYLEPVKSSDFPWKLDLGGRGELGTNTRLAF